MSTIWQFIATFALPAPLCLLVLLNLPIPKYVFSITSMMSLFYCITRILVYRPFKKTTVGLVARVFEVPLLGAFKLLHVMLVILGISLISAGRTLQRLQEQHSLEERSSVGGGVGHHVMYDSLRLNKRWRAERNLWLSAFAFTMWTVLAIFYREMARRLRVEDRLAEFETSDCTGTIDSTLKDVSVSKEVTSKPHALISPRKTPMGSGLMSPEREAVHGRGESPPPAPGIADALRSLDSASKSKDV